MKTSHSDKHVDGCDPILTGTVLNPKPKSR